MPKERLLYFLFKIGGFKLESSIQTRTKKLLLSALIICSVFLLLNAPLQAESLKKEDPISLYYFYNPDCEVCQSVSPSVYQFAEDHPDLIFIPYFVDFTNSSSVDYANGVFQSYNLTFTGVPTVLFIKAECKAVITGTNIQQQKLEFVYRELLEAETTCPDLDSATDLATLSYLFIYATGFISGLSPCILLILGFISASYISSEEQKQSQTHNEANPEDKSSLSESTHDKSKLGLHIRFIFGFILGTLLVYSLLSVALIYSLEILSNFVFGKIVQYIFAGLLIFLGLWYIIDASNENSKLFKTPDSIKRMFRTIITTKSMASSFLLGIVFTMIKLPCIGAILMALLLNISANPAEYYPKLFIYFMGVLTPLLIVSLLLVFGLNTDRLNSLRTKYRPALRFISGLIIIAIVLYSLFL